MSEIPWEAVASDPTGSILRTWTFFLGNMGASEGCEESSLWSYALGIHCEGCDEDRVQET